jgi:hypothetical protein
VPGLPEAGWFESRGHGGVLDLGIVACFRLGGWNSADGSEQASIVEPVDPFQGGELDGFQVSPRAAAPDHLGLVEAVDGLGEGIVVTNPDKGFSGCGFELIAGLKVAFGPDRVDLVGGNDTVGHSALMIDVMRQLVPAR